MHLRALLASLLVSTQVLNAADHDIVIYGGTCSAIIAAVQARKLGKTVIGISGLGLLITALTGLVLWCPKLNRKALQQALSIAYRGSWPRLNYSSHRAAGFFAAPVFLVLGFSGWYFNLPAWVTPLVSSVATVSAPGKPVNQAPGGGTRVSPRQALEAAQALYPHARLSRIALPEA